MTPPSEDKPRILLVGYGNPSRSDDSVGWYVAHRVAERLPTHVCVETYHQLELDLAEEILEYDQVIFVDAHVSDEGTGLIEHEIEPAYRVTPSSHHFTPSTLLAIAQALYSGELPRTVLYTVKAHDLNFGEQLSPQTKLYADQAVEAICRRLASE